MWERLLEVILAFVLVVSGWVSSGDQVVTPPTADPAPTSTQVLVTRVIDGDTIDIATGERVRFLGVDTPERGECFYSESTDFVREWLEGEAVRLERDERETDIYDRLLRYIFIERTPAGEATSTEFLVNDVLLAKGYADYLPIGPDRRYRLQFRDSWEAAQAAERGRWGACGE